MGTQQALGHPGELPIPSGYRGTPGKCLGTWTSPHIPNRSWGGAVARWLCSSPASYCTFAAHPARPPCMGVVQKVPVLSSPESCLSPAGLCWRRGLAAVGLKWPGVGWVPTRALPLSLKEGT